jgi:undecaprenyl diphosphate synthase
MVNIKDLFGIADKIRISREKMPKHVAITVSGTGKTIDTGKQNEEEANAQKFLNIRNIVKVGVKLNIPLFTFSIMHKKEKDDECRPGEVDALVKFFEDLAKWEFITENQVKINVLGKWYDLPGRLVDPIKRIIDETKDYDRFFFNICLNYDGQEEIADACKIIGRQIKAGKTDPDNIDVPMIKDNTYTSYFLPPDLMIFTGGVKHTNGFLLWDSKRAKIYFSEVLWPEFGRKEFLKGIEFYQGG